MILMRDTKGRKILEKGFGADGGKRNTPKRNTSSRLLLHQNTRKLSKIKKEEKKKTR